MDALRGRESAKPGGTAGTSILSQQKIICEDGIFSFTAPAKKNLEV